MCIRDRPNRRRVVEQHLEEVGEALVERRRALHFVEHTELRRQLGLHRELTEQTARERVQRADGGLVEIGQRGGRGVVRGRCFQRAADLVAQLGGGLLGERDCGDAGDRHAGSHEIDDPSDERAGFAGTGAGLISTAERAALKPLLDLPAAARPVLVRSNRTGNGRVVALAEYDALGMIPGDNLTPQKARILLMLGLTKTRDLAELRRMFAEY